MGGIILVSLPADEIQVQRIENLLSFYKAESLHPLPQQVAKGKCHQQ